MSRLVKSDSINLGDDRFVYKAPMITFDVTVCERNPSAEPVEDRARALMRDAESHSAKVRAQAFREADEIREQAQQEGFREGYDLGRARAEAEYGEARDQIARMLESLDEGRQELFRRHEQDLINLALDVAGKVVADRIERDDETFLRVFRRAVEGLSGHKIVRLRVSGREFQLATGHADYLRTMIPGAEKLEIQLIEDAPPGTLIVDTEEDNIDASADKQLEAIGQALENIRSQGDE